MKHDEENPNCPLNNVTADDISVDCKCEKLMGDKEKADNHKIFGEIVKVASELLGSSWMPCYEDDFTKRPTAKFVARKASKDKERRRAMAIKLREIADQSIDDIKQAREEGLLRGAEILEECCRCNEAPNCWCSYRAEDIRIEANRIKESGEISEKP